MPNEHLGVNNYSFLSESFFKESRAGVCALACGPLPAVERAKVDEQMRALIAAEPELQGRDVVTAAFVAVKTL